MPTGINALITGTNTSTGATTTIPTTRSGPAAAHALPMSALTELKNGPTLEA